MQKLSYPFTVLINRAQRRGRRAKPGSVLIMVVALLVLLALIGTAFIATARSDRSSTAQHVSNTEIELAAQGVLNVAASTLTGPLQVNTLGFRPAVGLIPAGASSVSPTDPGFETYVHPLDNPWIAPRLPDVNYVDGTPIPTFNATPVVVWKSLSDSFDTSLILSTPPAGSTTQPSTTVPLFYSPYSFESQYPGTFERKSDYPPDVPAKYVPIYNEITYTREQLVNAAPTYIWVPTANGAKVLMPALTFPVNPQAPLTTKFLTVVAADTDGDGIADAGLVRLPFGQLNGVVYYGAVRILDNSSALNAAIAMHPYGVTGTNASISPFTSTAGVPGDFFPTNIDLRSLLSSVDYGLLNRYRFGNSPAISRVGRRDDGSTTSAFRYASAQEAVWDQLGSRIDRAGLVGTNATLRYNALSEADGMALAYHFCLANQTQAPSQIESLIPAETSAVTYSPTPSTKGPADRLPFLPSEASNWFSTLMWFSPPTLTPPSPQFTAPTSPLPLRPLLVTRNPVSNFANSQFPDKEFWSAPASTTPPTATYDFGDRVINPADGRAYVCIDPPSANSGAIPGYNFNAWAQMPWKNHPTKISVNTGTFEQLWTSYWSVMKSAPAAPVRPHPLAATQDLQLANVMRDGKTVLTQKQMVQLRSALAAVNTIGLRDGANDVTSRNITLYDSAGGNPLKATVFGSERSPFFTEAMVEVGPPNGIPNAPNPRWVGIELYNPYPTAIDMTNWHLAILDRAAGMTFTDLGELAALIHSATTAPTVPAIKPPATPAQKCWINPGERLVFDNGESNRPTDIAAYFSSATYTGMPDVSPPIVISTLGDVIGSAPENWKEIVLLRPRLYNAPMLNTTAMTNVNNVPQTNVDPTGANNFAENTADLSTFVPLDELDLSGIISPPAPPAGGGVPTPKRYRYARANNIGTLMSSPPKSTYLVNSDASAAWHCVYPGPYDAQATGTSGDGPFRMAGLLKVQASTDPMPTPCGLGQRKAIFSTSGGSGPQATFQTRPIQINNQDAAGPNAPYSARTPASGTNPNGNTLSTVGAAGSAAYPLGQFLRNGDILQVPFIGSYTIYGSTVDAKGNHPLLEMNTLTMDAAMAEDGDPNDDFETISTGKRVYLEQIGRFCPIIRNVFVNNSQPKPPGPLPDDTLPASSATVANPAWRYHWAMSLFDYLTVNSPQQDYLPNIDPGSVTNPSYDPTLSAAETKIFHPKYPVVSSADLPTDQNAVANGFDPNAAKFHSEETAPIHGLININTASAKVLAAVPFLPASSSTPTNAQIAAAIVAYREQTGQPFQTLFDLMKVPYFSQQNDLLLLNANYEPGINQGNYSPYVPGGTPVTTDPRRETDPINHVYGDFQSRFLLLNRCSNLLTTRSDGFTAYVQVQGWRNLGTLYPEVVASRRTAAFLDRSTVAPIHDGNTGLVTGLTPVRQTIIPNE